MRPTTIANKSNTIKYILYALLLHICSIYVVAYLQDVAYRQCFSYAYIGWKFLFRLLYLIVPMYFMKKENIQLKTIGFHNNHVSLQILTGIFFGLIQVFCIITPTIAFGFQHELGTPMYDNILKYMIYLFYTIFAVGLFEELFFRGYMFYKLSHLTNRKWVVILISSLLFGICHFFGNGSFIQAIPQVILTTVNGILYCILREKIPCCTLLSLIVMHGIYDFGIAFSIYILQ